MKDFQITLAPSPDLRVSQELDQRAKSPLKKRRSFLLERRSTIEKKEISISSEELPSIIKTRTGTAPSPLRRINSIE